VAQDIGQRLDRGAEAASAAPQGFPRRLPTGQGRGLRADASPSLPRARPRARSA
jgi:hypothetical protein